jgi:hypothetical protein
VVKAAAYADAGIIDKYVWANLKCLYTIEERAAAGVVDKIRGKPKPPVAPVTSTTASLRSVIAVAYQPSE